MRNRQFALLFICYCLPPFIGMGLYVLFFIELGSRRVHMAGATANPTAACVTRQERHLSWQIQDSTVPVRYLIRDRDAKFPAAFDTVFRAEGVRIIRTPYRAPNANAVAERWIRSIREECLDKIVIMGEGHLRRVLHAYCDYYNHSRPHQGIEQQCPVPLERVPAAGPIVRRDVLGGVLHDYRCRAA